MIDTIKIKVPTQENKHLFQLGSKIEKVARLKQVQHAPGLVAMQIGEYKNKNGEEKTVYKFEIVRPNGYEIRVFGNDYFLTLEFSVTKFFYGTSYVYFDSVELLYKAIKRLRLTSWTLSRIDICRNYYFDSIEACDNYLGIIHATHNKNFTESYRTGFSKYTASSYNVVYQKHKDPRDIGLEIPILRFELKVTMRNTYKQRRVFGMTEINEKNLRLFVNLGQKRLQKVVDKFNCTKLPEGFVDKKAPRILKNMEMILFKYQSFENARELGAISKDTCRRYNNFQGEKYNTLKDVPQMYSQIHIKWKGILDSYLTKNRLICP